MPCEVRQERCEVRWVAMERRQTAEEAERASSVRRSMRFQMLFNALKVPTATPTEV